MFSYKCYSHLVFVSTQASMEFLYSGFEPWSTKTKKSEIFFEKYFSYRGNVKAHFDFDTMLRNTV